MLNTSFSKKKKFQDLPALCKCLQGGNFTGFTGTEKGELSIQMGCSLLPPGSDEVMTLTDILLPKKKNARTHEVEAKFMCSQAHAQKAVEGHRMHYPVTPVHHYSPVCPVQRLLTAVPVTSNERGNPFGL